LARKKIEIIKYRGESAQFFWGLAVSAAEGGGFRKQAGALPPPAGFHLFFRFRFLDLWIKFGKMMVKV